MFMYQKSNIAANKQSSPSQSSTAPSSDTLEIKDIDFSYYSVINIKAYVVLKSRIYT
ncbi:7817_t:CDS:2 [Entrophospora sp. SA101]|nr:7817_t:CDS:2 [Entrophospora sp. SA101]